ncbi:unnamed protein product [Pichia kudriavzevii]
MSDEEYIVRREVEYGEEEEQSQLPNPSEDSVFDNEFRILILANTTINKDQNGNNRVNVEESDMEEILIRQVRTLDDVNEFFDAFDSEIAQPNEGHLKYEVGSDGLCVVLVDSVKIKDDAVTFINRFIKRYQGSDDENNINHKEEEKEEEEEESRDSKRRK